MNINVPLAVTDNISELLIKIVEFTQNRQKLLTRNINNVHSTGFVPHDLDVKEFSTLINNAVEEHIRNNRIVFFDTENIKFGSSGCFEARPVVDNYSRKLRETDPDEYLELQMNRLLENSLNQKVAADLLKLEKIS